MKKILMLSVFAAVAFAGCKKKEDTVSKLITVSYPTITISTPQFYSFPVGGGPLPNANTIIASAYDSFYRESIRPVIDASTLSSIAPGLYRATLSAKNSHGFIGYAYVYVAITSVNDTINLAGRYVRYITSDDSVSVNVTRLAAGFYRSDNIGGEASTSKNIIPGVFIQESNKITLTVPEQSGGTLGTFGGDDGVIYMAPDGTDTTFQYVITGNANFDPTLRLFHKR